MNMMERIRYTSFSGSRGFPAEHAVFVWGFLRSKKFNLFGLLNAT
jgi:hypothetical protein